ncbi:MULTISPECIES: TraR/DksA family transcriptional regulator [Streptomyces]|jgi:RNA polymerase-binding transcription factor DksA|uniref:TraR/DksA family transcriptional regulator n=1 Tax=unclassified Streptomyces TaxID=2593676 RepID=UPI0008800379|nr:MULTISPECIES: TraR/DksA C4-type zinc finger protein [unclassified Streptomyces]MDX2729443.1 TraR/DksA C4-type zinc finger protein [Streptomyces sp. PA03-2a]MDX3768349.1 TraR/DksA C4-type zinc finger protein [Streptomyces sp. AK08-01B]MDX3817385.1 TraR/DksA C4-type zinc finger protein [Streptomyces sp. AK08-01A]SCY24575.1 RNA polymerase-binding transcription factor DksA [Streptomyces sp. 136MFCol5.1]SFS75780.1 transcriptional regulator, TraR/DksA family [Streptomyces sp. ok210]
MVAKKTAEQKSASARSPGAAAEATTEEAGSQTAADAGPRKAAAKSTAAKKTAAKKAVAKKAPAKKATAKKSAVKKASKKAAAADTGAAETAQETGAHTVVAKKSAARTRTAGKGAAPVPPARVAATEPGELAVRPGEDPWTPEEVSEARAELTSEIMRLRSELEASGVALAGLMRDSGNGAGDDEADTGTKNITREHEMALAANATEMLEQTERALARLDAGTYGLCEICGKPIGKARMQAFPRATLCVEDKQKQERRS